MKKNGAAGQTGQPNPTHRPPSAAQETDVQLPDMSPFLHTLAEEVAATLATRACCIYAVDRQRHNLIPIASWCASNTRLDSLKPAMDKIIAGVIPHPPQTLPTNQNANHTLIRIDDLTGDPRFQALEIDLPVRSILAAALPAAGLLLVADKLDAPSFSAEDEQTLITFAGRTDLNLALQNFELQHAEQRRNRELELIDRINQALAASPFPVDLKSTCRLVLGLPPLKELFRFDIAEICLLDEQTGQLSTVVRLPEDKTDIKTHTRTYRLNEGYTGWIAARRQGLLVADTHAQTGISPKVGVQNFPYRSYIGAPLHAGDKFIGTLELAATPPNFYTARDLTLLAMVANQAVIAIDHARRFNLTDQQLQRRFHELGGLQRVSRELNSTLDLDRILNIVLEEAMRVTQADYGSVSLYNARAAAWTIHKTQTGNQEPISEQFAAIPIQMSLMERALETGKAVLLQNVRASEDFVDFGRNTHSEVVVPVFYGGEPAGVINLESQHLNFFTNDQLRYLEALANHAAVAIGNAQAFQAQKIEREQASRRADQLARLAEISNAFRTNRPLHEVLEDIAYAIMESVGYNVVLISLVRGRPPVISHEVGAGIPVPEFKALQAAEPKSPLSGLQDIMLEEFCLGRAYFIPAERKELWQKKLDIPYIERRRHLRPKLPGGAAEQPPEQQTWQPGDLLFVPLTDTDNNIIGLLTVENPDTNRRPDKATAQTLEIFANHAAIAIENARLFELEQHRRRLANTLRGVAETISSQLEFDDLLNIVLQELKNVIDYNSASVQLLQEDKLVIIGGQGWEDSQQVIGYAFSMEGNNPNRKVVETQEPVIVKDVQIDYPASFSSPPHNRIRSWLGVPLTYGANVLGLMAVVSTRVDCFTPDDADVLLAFANQVAVALQNARLFEEARQQVHQLAALTEVAQFINRALNLDDVLNRVLDAVFDLVGESKGSIWLVDRHTRTVKIANTKNLPEFLVEALNESNISVNAEPFATVIRSGQVSVIKGSSGASDEIAHYGLPFPSDVTYVPLKTEEAVIGILAIETVIRQKNTLELVTTLANLAAVAIENARLVERLNQLTGQLEQRVEQRTRQLAEALQDLTEERDRVETLYQITRELSVSLDLDRVLTEALNLINRAIGISHGSILLLDHGSGELIYRAALGRDKPLPRGGLKTGYRLGYGLAGVVMELNEPRIIPDLSQDPDWIPGKDEPDHRSAIVVPLATSEGLMGAILLFHPESNYFNEDHLKLVSAAGAQIANAINNAELYRLITDQAERLGVMLRSEATEAAKNQAILKGIADGVLVLDAGRNVVLVNPKAAEILGVSPKTVENQPVDKILEQDKAPLQSTLTRIFYDNLLEHLSTIQSGQATAQFRMDVDGKAVVVTLTPVALGVTETLGVVAVLRDISKEAEIERMKNEFISTVSHELRTPLTSIKGYADLLVSKNAQVGKLNDMQQRFVRVIQSNANRLTELVNDILEISRIETGRIKLQFESLDVIRLIQDVAVSFEGQIVKKAMDLSLNLPGHLPEVYADKTRLTQILMNLIGNAWQYTAEGGQIEVSARLVGDEFVQIDVSDNGIGIPEEDLAHIFERFFRSERHEVQLVDGTGLGLSITKSFVEMLGGKIWVKSRVNQGTTFSFTVPLASRRAPETPPAQNLEE